MGLQTQPTLRHPNRGSELGLRRQGVCQSSRRVPIKQCALPELEIDVFVVIHVPHSRPVTFLEIQRHRRLHLANAAVDATGDAFLSALKAP